MNPGSREGWPPAQNQGPVGGSQSNENTSAQSSRPLGRFEGSSTQQSQSQQQSAPSSGPVLPPPSASYHSSGPPNVHNLPPITGIAQASQASPQQPSLRAPQDTAPGAQSMQGGLQGGGYPLPAINQSLHPQHHGPPPPSIESRMEEHREARENERMIAADELVALDQRERENRERHQQEQAAHENHGGPIQLHQPVAVAPQVRGIHGPNGLLGNVGAIANASSLPGSLGVSNAQAMFGAAPPPQGDTTPRMQHTAQQQQQSLLLPFGGPGGAQQQLSMGQGQQPILNDALSYLDQVKVQFQDQPDVYNRFLDIMKDFKSGAIDTPGVIDRVSSLFAGNPSLIQGFNTFLPPGYRIECGTGDDPNSIRVTTPMGTTVSSLPSGRPLSAPRSAVNGATSAPSDRTFYDPANRSSGTNWPQQTSAPATEIFSPGRAAQPLYGMQQNQTASVSPEIQRARPDPAIHAMESQQQLEQRGVSQLQNAAAAASAGQGRQGLLSPPSGPPGQLPSQTLNGIANATQAGSAAEKRGPVEFNHAISYVNKIKNRFATQPDIYKQFLEILQTYQRESKPIQDVYAQVTTLFGSAPDLLEDFKQFLPETTTGAQQRAVQVVARHQAEESTPISNLRGDASYIAQSQHLQQTPRSEQQSGRLPPIGNFAPTPAKDSNKRKRGDRQGAGAVPPSIPPPALEPISSNRNYPHGVKRTKQHHPTNKVAIPDGPLVSPTLTPALPDPIQPTTTTSATNDELAFFDRVKKFIGNKNNMNEFLKLCNLFSQDLISSEMLVTRSQSFIGGNPELMTWFKNFMGYEPKNEIIEAKAQQDYNSKVSLSNCRGLGPSYRLLPKRDRMRVCSGRDDLCRSVLNDEWASHPTWASEDSGFIAHRKNQHEEGLHRIEEERHDYDFNIEACLRTVQQLEPIALQLSQMSADDRLTFVLPKGLGGQSESIYKRVIMKVYGREKGQLVINNLFDSPYKVVPVVLGRLKSKLEEWKAAQREWEKVWREQTQRIFWKSLDHQSIGAKQADKRQFQTKTLQTEIQVKHEEQKRQREVQNLTVPQWQFEYAFDDVDVLYDAARLVLVQVEHNQSSDHPRLYNFMKEFIPLFFGLDVTTFEQRIRISPNGTPGHDDLDEETPSPDDHSSRSQRGQRKNQNLLRGVLDRGRNGARNREDSNASGSRASTPEVGSNADEEMTGTVNSPSGEVADERPQNKWLEHPILGNQNDLAPDEPYERDIFNMYANLPIYCFFRMLVILYERLLSLKRIEDEVHDIVKKAKSDKPAIDFKLIDKLPSDFFGDTSPTANYYEQVLALFEDVVKGELDMSHVEDTLRRFYLQTGWQLYSVDKMLGALGRFAVAVMTSDAKDKSWDIYQLFKKDRQKSSTTHKDEINYRRQVEKYAKDGDVFRISFRQNDMTARVQIFKKDDLTFDPRNYSAEQKWRYYISTYTNVEPTEGMENQNLSKVLLSRHLDVDDISSDDDSEKYRVTKSDQSMTIRIAVNGYKMIFEPKTEEYHVKSDLERSGGPEGLEEMENERRQASDTANEKLVMNNTWMKGLSKEEVDQKNLEYARWKAALGDEGVSVQANNEEGGDVAMADAS